MGRNEQTEAFKLREARRRGFCLDFIKDTCRFGDRCKFSHDDSDDAASTRPPSDDGWTVAVPTPAREVRKPSPPRLILSDEEEKEVKKIEKKLREITVIENKISSGVAVDKLQQDKLAQKQDLLKKNVMAKVRRG